EMNNPGVWILGAPEDDIRNAGLGVIIEYSGQRRQPQWIAPGPPSWDYTLFGRSASLPKANEPERKIIDMRFEKIPRGRGQFNSFLVNGKEYPHEQEFVLQRGMPYRLILRNRTDDA